MYLGIVFAFKTLVRLKSLGGNYIHAIFTEISSYIVLVSIINIDIEGNLLTVVL